MFWLGAKQWLKNVAVAIDQVGNALAGGDPQETVSSQLGKRQAVCKLCRVLCRLLDKIDPRHCHESINPLEGSDSVWAVIRRRERQVVGDIPNVPPESRARNTED